MNALMLIACLVLAQVEGPLPEAGEADALVERIQENLTRIDETLLSTIDADDPAAALEDVRQAQMQVIRDLEALIDQAKYKACNSGGGGGAGGGGQAPPEQPPEQPSDPRQSDGSAAPQPEEGGAPQPPASQDGEQLPPRPEGSRPEQDDPLDDSDAPRNRDGPPPAPQAIAPPIREDTDARWGLLPPKLQERLMNLHVDDVPARYRDWLAAYIRAMQQLEEQAQP